MFKIKEYSNGKIKITVNEEWTHNSLLTECSKKIINLNRTRLYYTLYSVGLEVAVHRGGRICYGLLSASISPNDNADSMLLSVAYTQKNTEKYCESILLDDKHCYKGLSYEYLEAVINGAVKSITEIEKFPLCNISFDYSLNCEDGSSPMFFSIIAESLIELISMLNVANLSELTLKPCEDFLVNKFGLRN